MADHREGPGILDPRSADPRIRRLLARHRLSGGTHAADRRVAGIHRAEGLSGTPWRYAAIVAFLVAMASLPVLAAISAGSATLADDGAGQTTPFIAEQAEVPAVIVPWIEVPIGPGLGGVEPAPVPAVTTGSAETVHGHSEHRPGPVPPRLAVAPARAGGAAAPPRVPEVAPVPTVPVATPTPPLPGSLPPRVPGWKPPAWKPPHPPGKRPVPPHRDPSGRRPVGCGRAHCAPVAPPPTLPSPSMASPAAQCGRTRRRPRRGRHADRRHADRRHAGRRDANRRHAGRVT